MIVEEKKILPRVMFEDVLNEYTEEESFEFRSGRATRTSHFGSFPKYLWIQMNRYTCVVFVVDFEI